MRVLMTGGAGFVGHHIIEHILKNTDWDIVTLDRLGVSGNLNRLTDIKIWEQEKHRVKAIHHDLRSPINEYVSREIGDISYILHVAASSHVDRSIEDPLSFVLDNVVGTTNLLNFARTIRIKRFLYFSTDEVFGPAPEGVFYKEWDRYNSGNPYAAAKAGGEEMVLAFGNTYGLPILITHTMNVFGQRQHPEKFLPKIIKSVLNGEVVPIHANKDKTKSGTRFYIHGRNVGAAILFVLNNGTVGEKYNIVGEKEVSNLEMAQTIAEIITKPLNYEMVDFHSARPGHDLRYALDGSKLKEMGWTLPKTFDDSLKDTVEWYLNNQNWL